MWMQRYKRTHPWVNLFCGYTSRCFVAKIWTLFLFHTHTHKSKDTHVLMICTFKSALTNSYNCKVSPKKKKNKCRKEGVKSWPPRAWFGALWFLEWLRQPAGKVAYKTRAGSRVNTKSKEEARGLGCAGPRGTPPPTPHTLLWLHLLHVTAGTEGCRSHSVVTRQLQPCQRPPSSHWEKGEPARDEGGGEAPRRAAPPRIRGASWNAQPTDCCDVAIPSGAPGVGRRQGAARREQHRMGGATHGTGEFSAKNLAGTEVLSGEGARICLSFYSEERSQQGRVWSSPGAFGHCSSFPLLRAICWPLQRNLSPSQFQLRRQFLIRIIKKNSCCLNGRRSLLAEVPLAVTFWNVCKNLKKKKKNKP